MLTACRRHPLPSRDHLRIMDLPRLSDQMAEVARAKEQDIITWHCGNCLDPIQRLRRLDLEDQELLRIAVVQVLLYRHLAKTAVDVAPINGTPAQRLEASHLHQLAGLLFCGDMRHHDGRGIQFKGLHIVTVRPLADPYDAVQVMQPGSPHLVLQIRPVIRNVFIADPDA